MAATRFGSVPPRAALATLEILARLLRAAIAASFVARFFGTSRFFFALRDGMGGKNSTACRASESCPGSMGGSEQNAVGAPVSVASRAEARPLQPQGRAPSRNPET